MALYYLPLSHQEFLVLWLTSEGLKNELTLEPTSVLNLGLLEWESSGLTTRPLRPTFNLVSTLIKDTFSSFLQRIIKCSTRRTTRFMNCQHLVMSRNVINVPGKSLWHTLIISCIIMNNGETLNILRCENRKIF